MKYKVVSHVVIAAAAFVKFHVSLSHNNGQDKRAGGVRVPHIPLVPELLRPLRLSSLLDPAAKNRNLPSCVFLAAGGGGFRHP